MCRCHRLPGAIGACLVVSHIHCRRRCLPGASVALPSHAVRFHTRPIQLLETIAALPVRLVWCHTLGRSVRLSETIGALPSRFGKRQTQCRSRRLCRLTSSRSGRVNKFQYRGQGQAWSSVTRSSATVMSLRFSMAFLTVSEPSLVPTQEHEILATMTLANAWPLRACLQFVVGDRLQHLGTRRCPTSSALRVDVCGA